MAVRPLIDRRIVEALLETELRRAGDRRLLLVNARYDGAAPREFTARIDGRQRPVRVTDQDSVLGVVDAWQRLLADPAGDRVLVVTSEVPATVLGWDVRAHAVGRRSLPVDRAELVKQLFGATDLDARMVRETWLLDALLEAEPVDGWPRGGSVLTRDSAVQALVGERLGLGPGAAGNRHDLDSTALLAWSRTTAGPARFRELPEAEREGLTAWLTDTVGAAAPTLLALAADGRAQDAMALGVLGSVLSAADAPAGTSFALGGIFGSTLRSDDLPGFTASVTGTLARWIAEAEANSPAGAEARHQVYDVLDRADELAAEAGLEEALRAHPLLPSGLKARLRELADALDASPRSAEAALDRVLTHHLARLHPASCDAAVMALRVLRWLDGPVPTVESVGQAVGEHLAQWGWVDRALAVLAAGDPMGDPVLGKAYHLLIGRARARRSALDEQFAARLAGWALTAAPQAPGGALLIEDVLATLAVPVASRKSPLVLVLDGMSAAVAAQLGDEIDRRVWTEIVPAPPGPLAVAPRRQAAVSMLPSVTTISRASLLCGAPTSGKQAVESSGFATFWQQRRRTGKLFHKGRIAGDEGHRLAPELLEALAGHDVVGVVLNTIDDALDHGQEGERSSWRLADISHLLDLLNAARGYGRPVILVSDHGHVTDRSPQGQGPVKATGARSARWRTGGPAGEGEVELSGPRVREGGGTIVVPWREDIRYTPRKAGYHGGASMAEVTVPVITLVPSQDLMPPGWVVLPEEQAVPSWWRSRAGTTTAEAEDTTVRRPRRRARTQAGEGLFNPAEVVPRTSTLGGSVVGSQRYRTQKVFVRRAPDAKAVAAVIDALAEAGGRLTPDAVAAAAAVATGRSQRNAEIFVTVVQRLLNVEGYGVINLVDGGRTVELNVPLLEEQFGTERP